MTKQQLLYSIAKLIDEYEYPDGEHMSVVVGVELFFTDDHTHYTWNGEEFEESYYENEEL